MLAKDLEAWGAGLTAIVAGLTGLFVLGRKVAKAGSRAALVHERMVALTDRLTPATVDAIVAIAHQLKPNGGSSLHDKISRIETAMLRDNAVRRQQISATGLAFWESDAEGKTIFASDALSELIGIDTDGILGNGWVTNLHPEDRERVYQEWSDAMEQKRAFLSVYRFVHRDGQSVTVQGRSHPILDRNGNVLGHVGTLMPA
jgi:PAS domain S-box-containing protein